MALGAGAREVLVESDFLFGLRAEDRHHQKVLRVLSMHKKGTLAVKVLSSAVVEVRTVLYSRGLRPQTIEEALSLVDAQLAGYSVGEFVPVALSDAVVAERLRSQHEELGFFDSLHAAAGKRLGVVLLSSDPIYRKLSLPAADLATL